MNFLRLLQPSIIEKANRVFASGRWWPQPEWNRSFASSAESPSSLSPSNAESSSDKTTCSAVVESNESTEVESEHILTAEELGLPRQDAFPSFAPRRGDGRAVYRLVPGRNGEPMAGYNLFVGSIRRCEVSWIPYDSMTKEEKHVYIAHLKAVEARKLEYTDPIDKTTRHKTISALIYAGECCGEGCRHCPYDLDNCSSDIRKHLAYNGAYYL